MQCRAIVIAVLCMVASSATAVQINVDSTLDEVDAVPGDGACVSTPSGVCTVRAAVMEANALSGFDIVSIPAGTYTLGIAGTGEDSAATGDLDLRETIAIYGVGADLTIIDGAQIDRVFDVVLDDAYLDSLTIRNGSAVTASGFLGGGVNHRGGNLTLLAVRITGNQANQGGGLYVCPSCSVEINTCTIDNNLAADVGQTNQYGAAIYSGGDLDLHFSTVTANSNESGTSAAVHLFNCSSSAADVFNSTIADNQVAGLTAYNCDLSLRSSTIAGNVDKGLSFGVYAGLTMSLTATHTIISDTDSGSDCNLTTGNVSFASSLDSDGSCGLSPSGGNLPGADAALLPLRNWGHYTATVYPKPGASAAIDAGANGANCPGVDQRNFQRPFDGDGNGVADCDIGAVEAGDLILWSDFESGLTDEWSTTVP